jgi:hypothetical protein
VDVFDVDLWGSCDVAMMRLTLSTKDDVGHVPMDVPNGIPMGVPIDVPMDVPMDVPLKRCSLTVCMFVPYIIVHLFPQFLNLFPMCSLM